MTRRNWAFWLAGMALLLGSVLSLPSVAANGAQVPDTPESTQPLLSIPLGKGLPVVVRTGLYFHHVEAFDDNKSSFEATTDLRLSWHDPRLRYPASEGLHGYKEYRVSAAEAQLAKLWTPPVRFANRIGEPTFSERRLRIYPDGRVETIARTTAVYKTPVDVSRFPFDHQVLQIELVVREDTVESVDLDYSSEDVEFSKAGKRVALSGWTPGLVNLKRELVAGWNGDRYAKVLVELDVRRDAGGTIATIFIPLFASLLIPFLATWMNRAEGGGFEIEGFELANVIIGGLFAVIALGFTINSAFPLLAQSDNTVSRLLGLNYTALAVGLVITVAFYRYSLPARWFGAHVQEQMFRFLAWAFPVAFIATGLGFVAMAAA
jgi:Neurotransmitter-gated ion-channel ligand binding domain